MISPMPTELEDLFLAAINFIRYKKKKYLDFFLLAFAEKDKRQHYKFRQRKTPENSDAFCRADTDVLF